MRRHAVGQQEGREVHDSACLFRRGLGGRGNGKATKGGAHQNHRCTSIPRHFIDQGPDRAGTLLLSYTSVGRGFGRERYYVEWPTFVREWHSGICTRTGQIQGVYGVTTRFEEGLHQSPSFGIVPSPVNENKCWTYIGHSFTSRSETMVEAAARFSWNACDFPWLP